MPKHYKSITLFIFMLIGEGIFLLPFVITRVFRPTFLTVFEINNLQLGSAFSVYGIVAAVSYFFGGPLADRFSPKNLLIVSLLATSVAGFLLAGVPSLNTLTLLYAFWGFSTILLFWSAYIKGIRQFGGENSQGKSQGLVDGGRGFIAAILATSSVFLLDAFLPTSADTATYDDLKKALSSIILVFSFFVVLCAIIVWAFLKTDTKNEQQVFENTRSFEGLKKAIKHRSVWTQSLILLSAYVGYKCTDDFGLFVKDTYGYDDVISAHMATISFWMRPIAAVIAGFLGDRFLHSKVTTYSFILLIVGSLLIAFGVLFHAPFVFISISIASVSIGIYALRGLYYALFQESKIPLSYTGAAIGFIAVVGYTPDIFMGPLMGVLLDNNPGALGHQYVFGLLSMFGVIGLIACRFFIKETKISK